ncbi:MAG: cytochrome c [Microthrixaceae bacterium]
MTSTQRRWAALVLAAGLAMSGCASDSDSADGGSTDDSTETTAAGGGGGAASGEAIFAKSCSSCHGKDAKGLPNLGKDLTASEFAKGMSDAELVAFIKKGRDTSDPANTTGVAMPPKGGNPALSDDDLAGVVAYLRTLEK